MQNGGSRDKQQGVAGSIISRRDTQPTADIRLGHKLAVLCLCFKRQHHSPKHSICKLGCWNGSRKERMDFPAPSPTSHDAWSMGKETLPCSMQDKKLILKQGYSKLGIWSRCRYLAGFPSKCSIHNWKQIFSLELISHLGNKPSIQVFRSVLLMLGASMGEKQNL